MRTAFDSEDTAALTEILDDFAYDEVRFASAVLSPYEQSTDWRPGWWLLMLIKRDGTVDILQRRLERKQARKALQLTAEIAVRERR